MKRSKRHNKTPVPHKPGDSLRSAILLRSRESKDPHGYHEQVAHKMEKIITYVLTLSGPSERHLPFEDLREMCIRVRELLLQEPPFVEVEPPVYVFGDLHGQLLDLQKMLMSCGTPANKRFLFLGDYVDRGAFGIETISLLLAFKLRYPTHITLLRGNHETRVVNTVYGFSDECKRKYGTKGAELWTFFQSAFNCLPLAALIGDRIFCAHGGISEHLYTFDQLTRLQRPTEITDVGLVVDLIWSDPTTETETFAMSPRGISKVFGKQACAVFCHQMNVDFICRAHQCVEDGYEFFADRRCLTVFSAPNYCGEKDNKAGVLYVGKEMKCQVLTFKPDAHLQQTSKVLTAKPH